MAFDRQLQRKIFGRFATGVTVVVVEVKGETRGMTASAVTSVSLDPPLALVCVAKSAEFAQYIRRATAFSLNILAADQRALSDRFAFTGPRDCSGLVVTTALTGTPILSGTLGWVDCRIQEVLQGGDHEIYLGEIVAGEVNPDKTAPLLYFQGGYRSLGPS